MLVEVVRYTVTNGRTQEVRQLPITGPVAEVAKSLEWARKIDVADGWYVVKGSVKFGSIQNGQFQEIRKRPVPLFAFDGFRRMASHLRA